MIRRPLAPATAFLVTLALGLCACSSTSKQSAGLKQVDDLLSRIERVHVETELAKARLREVLQALQVVVDPAFVGDPVEAYTRYVQSLEVSEKQATALRRAVEPMKRAAEPFFNQWTMEMESFANPTMRERSQLRLNATRDRYTAIVAAVDPGLASYDSINIGLRDCAVFLGHDFNPTAVQMIRQDVQHLTGRSARLDGLLDQCLAATRAYAEETAFARPEPAAPGEGEGEATDAGEVAPRG